MYKYTKIETLYTRDTQGTKQLLDRNGDRIIVKIKWCDFKDLVA